jgi:cytochrome P450
LLILTTTRPHSPSGLSAVAERCPVAHGSKYGGFRALLKYDDVKNAARDYSRFSSENAGPDGGLGIMIPGSKVQLGILETDPPRHRKLRGVLTNWIAPSAIDRFEPRIRQLAIDQLELAGRSESFDVVDDFSSPFAARVTLEFMGFPPEEWKTFALPLFEQTYVIQTSPEFAEVERHIEVAQTRMLELISLRREQPADNDFLSLLVQAEVNGETFSDELILSMVWQIMGAGFDTVAGTTQHIMRYLTEMPELRQRLIDDPHLIPSANEEFLRFFSPGTAMARTVTEDTEVGGATLSAGERILLCYAAANHDPDEFEQAEEVKLDRSPNRHLAFGDGVHRCLGARFARVELKVLMEEILSRLPDFEVDIENSRLRPSVGLVNSYSKMPCFAHSRTESPA